MKRHVLVNFNKQFVTTKTSDNVNTIKKSLLNLSVNIIMFKITTQIVLLKPHTKHKIIKL